MTINVSLTYNDDGSSGSGNFATTFTGTAFGASAGDAMMGVFCADIVEFPAAPGLTATCADSLNGSWTQLASIDDVSGGQRFFVFYRGNSALGTVTPIVTYSSSRPYKAAAIYHITGAAPLAVVLAAPAAAENYQVAPPATTDGVTSGNITGITDQPFALIGIAINIHFTGVPSVGSTGWTSLSTGWAYAVGTDTAVSEWKRVTSFANVPALFTRDAGATDSTVAIAVAFQELGSQGRINGVFFGSGTTG